MFSQHQGKETADGFKEHFIISYEAESQTLKAGQRGV